MEAPPQKKLYKCDECFMAYSSKYALKRHADRAHNEDATRYSCCEEGCDYYSYRAEDLLNHEKRHQKPEFKTRKITSSTPKKPEPVIEPQFPLSNTFNQQDLDFASQFLMPPQMSTEFPTVNQECFTGPQIVSVTKTSDVPPTELEPKPYVPSCSDISDPEEELYDTSGTVYEAGLCLFATKSGRLQVKKNALKPGLKCIVNENYELISEDMAEYKELTKVPDSPNPNTASFNITITNPGNTVNDCNTQ